MVIVFVSRTDFSVLQVGTEGGEPERTVDVMEFYGALKHYKLLENKVTSERVAQLKAVSKQDATRIFKQCTRTDKGTYMPRMTQVGRMQPQCFIFPKLRAIATCSKPALHHAPSLLALTR